VSSLVVRGQNLLGLGLSRTLLYLPTGKDRRLMASEDSEARVGGFIDGDIVIGVQKAVDRSRDRLNCSTWV
jgi:hypothetical protein